MENENNENSQDQVKKQLEELNQKIEALKNGQVPEKTSNEKALEMIFDKGTPLLMGYMQLQNEANTAQSEKDCELEREEMVIINKLDTKEKVYKGIMIGFCLTALMLASLFLEKAECIIPVLSLIIGLLFKSNSLSDFFSHAKHKLRGGEE